MSMTALFLAVAMAPAGGMNVKVEADGLNGTFAIDPPNRIEVKGERHPCLPPKTKTPFWAKECRFKAAYNPQFLAAWAVDLDSVAIFADGRKLSRGRDYMVDEHGEDEHAHSITSLSAFSGLAIHSFFDGLALAAAFTAGEDVGLLVLVGLCLHKTVVAFSLASTMIMGENPRTAWTYLIIFSLVSPLATVASYAFLNSGEFSYTGPALCLSAGIFMFVTMCDILPEAFHHRGNDPKQLLCLLLGLAVAILVATVSGMLMGDIH